MSFKAINDLVGFNGLVFTLLVFDSYLKITKQDAPFSSITKSALAMKKAINEVQKSTTFQQINNVLNTWNKSSRTFIHDLLINLTVFVYQERNAGQ